MARDITKLTDAEVEAFLHTSPAWSLQDGALRREGSFRDFAEAMAFVNTVAGIAEEADHHPDIDIRYNRVVLALVSHDAGGITARDVAMAQQLNAVFPTSMR